MRFSPPCPIRQSLLRQASIVLILCWVATDDSSISAQDPASAEIDYFEKHIRPVLVDHCYECHSSKSTTLSGGLRLDISDGWMQGGDSGPAVIAGRPDESLLLRAIRYEEGVTSMPPSSPLDAKLVARIALWIERGAVGPKTRNGNSPAKPVTHEAAPHWAFQKPQAVTDLTTHFEGMRPTSRIDLIVFQAQRDAGLPSSPEALPPTLVRRLFIDLTGLPPTFEQLESAIKSGDDWYSQLVDQLLASPRFGERWGRHWLDLARFADTKGYVFREDRNYPDAYKYRDWVIRAFNSDRPYNEFVRYQLAADQLVDDDANELAAMGFLTLGRRFLNNRHDIIDDRIDVTTRGLMGLTVTCARCHDHKYDPIPAADYYSLYGVFASSKEPNDAPSPLRLIDVPEPVVPVVFLRGKPDRKGPEVPRQFLSLVAGPDRKPFEHGSGRLEMADAIVATDNPLTSRVIVNRVWGHLMGRHLVTTPSDFGTRSVTPRLHRLLDDLTVDFIQNEMSIKWLVRTIVTSSIYRQSSNLSDASFEVDPENTLWARATRKRYDFETMRDALLFVSGQLDGNRIGGPSVEIIGQQPSSRRTIYMKIDRQNFPSLFRTFDVALPDTHAPKRFATTVPQQALFLMNSPFIMNCAELLTDRVLATSEPTTSQREQVRKLFRLSLGRDPDAWEVTSSLHFLNSDDFLDFDERLPWEQLSQNLIISNEFFFLD